MKEIFCEGFAVENIAMCLSLVYKTFIRSRRIIHIQLYVHNMYAIEMKQTSCKLFCQLKKKLGKVLRLHSRLHVSKSKRGRFVAGHFLYKNNKWLDTRNTLNALLESKIIQDKYVICIFILLDILTHHKIIIIQSLTLCYFTTTDDESAKILCRQVQHTYIYVCTHAYAVSVLHAHHKLCGKKYYMRFPVNKLALLENLLIFSPWWWWRKMPNNFSFKEILFYKLMNPNTLKFRFKKKKPNNFI